MSRCLGCENKTYLRCQVVSAGYWLLCAVRVPSLSSCRSTMFWSDLQLKNDRMGWKQLVTCAIVASLEFLSLIEEVWEGRKWGTQGCCRLFFEDRLARSWAYHPEEYEGIYCSTCASSLPRRCWGKVCAGSRRIVWSKWAGCIDILSAKAVSFLHKHPRWIYCSVWSTNCAFVQLFSWTTWFTPLNGYLTSSQMYWISLFFQTFVYTSGKQLFPCDARHRETEQNLGISS